MKDDVKTSDQLISELNELRRQIVTMRRSEEELRQFKEHNEKFVKAFMKCAIPMAISTIKEGKYIDVSEAFLDLRGCRRSEIIGKTSIELGIVTEEQRSLYLNELSEKGRVENLEIQARTKRGEVKYGLFSAVAIDLGDEPCLLTVMIDITERKRAEEALKQSENKYRGLVDLAVDGILTSSHDGIIIDANDSACMLSGLKREQMIGMHVSDFLFTPESVRKAPLRIDLLQKGEIVVAERTLIRPDMSVVQIETHSKMMPDGTYQSIYHDITQRKRMEEALQEAEKRFLQVTENAGEFIWEVDTEGLYRYCSPAVERILGYVTDELVGKKHFYDLFMPEERESTKKEACEVIKDHQPFRNFLNSNLHKNGKIVIIESSGTPVLDEKGNLLGYRGTDMDVTERKELEQEKFKLLDIIEKSFNEVYVFDAVSLKFEYANQEALRNLGYTLEELRNLTPVDIKPEFTEAVFRETIAPLVEDDQKSLVFETIHQRRNGTEYIAEVRLQLHKQKDKSVFWAVINDITERKRDEAEREKLISEIQKALSEVRTLSGLLPICSSCKKIRDDNGYWNKLEAYIMSHSNAEFSHAICPECAKKLYPKFCEEK